MEKMLLTRENVSLVKQNPVNHNLFGQSSGTLTDYDFLLFYYNSIYVLLSFYV